MKKIVVVGGGTMGLDIAHTFARSGHAVVVREISDELAEKSHSRLVAALDKLVVRGKMDEAKRAEILGNITFTTDLAAAADADLVLEAIVENLDVKKSLFQELDGICKADTIFATNTSSISITAIAADDVAQESRAFRVDASEEGDPMMALAQQFADQDYDVLLYDEHSSQNRRGEFVAQLAKDSGAQGVVLFMQQFCDPEEMEYPYLKKALDEAGVPHIKLGVDQQMRDFGQASTAIQAFADVL